MPLPHTLVNSNYTQKHIVDADKLMDNFQYLLDQLGDSPLKNLIISTGQVYNKLNAQQLIAAIVQLAIGGQYFVDTSNSVNTLILSPKVSTYANPTTYVDKMEFLFTPSRTNTGNTTILFSGLDSVAYTKPLYDSLGNELTASAISVNNTYVAHFDESRNAFILGSLKASSNGGGGSGGFEDFISNVIESLGVLYSSSNTEQLVKAIAEYALITSYKDVSTSTDQNNQVYRLSPYNEEGVSSITLATPFNYYNGMTLRFRPVYTNTSTAPQITINSLNNIVLYRPDGSALEAGDIRLGIDTVVRYEEGAFYLLSNKMNKLSLGTSTSVNNIETTLTNSSTSLPTSSAVYNVTNSLSNDIVGIKNSRYANKAYCVATSLSGSIYAYYNEVVDPQQVVTARDIILTSGTSMLFPDFEFYTTTVASTLSIMSVTGSFKILYIKNQGLVCVSNSAYTESFVAPTTAGNNGDAYVYIDTNGRVKTYIYNTTLASWVETPFVKVGHGTESSGTVTFSAIPLGCKVISTNAAIPTSSTSTIITHNIDSPCQAKVLLRCITSDLAYVPGDVIELSSFVTASAFFTIGNTSTTTVLNTTGILLPDSQGTPTAITTANWELLVEISRIF